MSFLTTLNLFPDMSPPGMNPPKYSASNFRYLAIFFAMSLLDISEKKSKLNATFVLLYSELSIDIQIIYVFVSFIYLGGGPDK